MSGIRTVARGRLVALCFSLFAVSTVCSFSTVSVALADDTKSKKKPQAAFMPIFDGKSLKGWTYQNGKPVTKGWKAIDGGVLEFSGKGGTIMTEKEFADFDLRFEFKIVPGGNSGLKYKFKKFGKQWLGCEYQVLDDSKHGDGKNPRTATAALYHVCEADQKKKKLNPPGKWNQGRIVVSGSKIEHWLNGAQVVAIDTKSPEWKERKARSKFKKVEGFGENKLGRIMLQDHGSKVWYRNLMIKELSEKPAAKK